MIEQVRIQDFQSIEKIDLDCGGITVVYGESDTGKSAVVRALNALAFNNYPSGHVRDGSKFSYVSAVVDGVVISAEKGDGKNGYRLTSPDGSQLEWDKVGTEVPPEVAQVLGWRQLELDDGSRFTPNFHLQFDAPFLLTDSPSRRAKVLGTLTNVATLYAAIKEANSWERKAKNRAEAQQEIIERTTPRIETIEGRLDEARAGLDALTTITTAAWRAEEKAAELEQLFLSMVGTKATVDTATAVVEMMDASRPEGLDEMERLITKGQGLTAMIGNIESWQQAVAKVADEDLTLEIALLAVQDQLAEFKVCPMCGHQLEEGHEHE